MAARQLEANQLASPRRDAEFLLAAVLGQDRAFLYTHPEHPLAQNEEKQLREWLDKRSAHYPLQYLSGQQEFFGRLFRVRPGVFIPRPETELLVETALALLREKGAPELLVADVGTGSGCIGITLACEEPRVLVTATDSSPVALEVAQHNARLHRCQDRVEFLQAESLEPPKNPGSAFHVIVSNPPYVSSRDRDQVDPAVAQYEPSEAVFAGDSGLEAYVVLFREAPHSLRPQGFLVLELGCSQAAEVVRLAKAAGWSLADLRQDLAGIDRCAVFSRHR